MNERELQYNTCNKGHWINPLCSMYSYTFLLFCFCAWRVSAFSFRFCPHPSQCLRLHVCCCCCGCIDLWSAYCRRNEPTSGPWAQGSGLPKLSRSRNLGKMRPVKCGYSMFLGYFLRICSDIFGLILVWALCSFLRGGVSELFKQCLGRISSPDERTAWDRKRIWCLWMLMRHVSWCQQFLRKFAKECTGQFGDVPRHEVVTAYLSMQLGHVGSIRLIALIVSRCLLDLSGMETVNLVVEGFDFLPVFLITYMLGPK